MLTPLGRQTLAYRIFDAQQEGSLADIGLGGILLFWDSHLLFKGCFIVGDDMSESIPLNVQNLEHSYGSTLTFRGLNLQIRSGELIALLGFIGLREVISAQKHCRLHYSPRRQYSYWRKMRRRKQ